MTDVPAPGDGNLVREEVQSLPVTEVVALRSTFRGPAHWPVAPGSVRRDAAGRAIVLHFAPGRWLATASDPGVATLAHAGTQEGDCTATDVTGKWQIVRLVGAQAARVLASSIDVEAALPAERECAATTLFDCPVIIVRDEDGFTLWVRSSYRVAILAAIRQVRCFHRA